MLTIAANTPRQSRLVSRVRILLIRACCCTCIGLSLCLTRPFFSTASSPAPASYSTAEAVVALAARSSCFRLEVSFERPSSPSPILAQRDVNIRRLRFLSTRHKPSSPARGRRAERGNARLLPSACTAGLKVSLCSRCAGTAHAGIELPTICLVRISAAVVLSASGWR